MWFRPIPCLKCVPNCAHFNAFRRTHLKTFFATGAGIGKNCVDLFGTADDGVRRTSLVTLCAAYAQIFMNKGNPGFLFIHIRQVNADAELRGQRFGQRSAAGRAKRYSRFAAGNRGSRRSAARITTLTTL